MIKGIEKVLYYPVTIIVTVLAFQSWTDHSRAMAAVLAIDALALWILPVYRNRYPRILRFLFWTTFVCLVLAFLFVASMANWNKPQA